MQEYDVGTAEGYMRFLADRMQIWKVKARSNNKPRGVLDREALSRINNSLQPEELYERTAYVDIGIRPEDFLKTLRGKYYYPDGTLIPRTVRGYFETSMETDNRFSEIGVKQYRLGVFLSRRK